MIFPLVKRNKTNWLYKKEWKRYALVGHHSVELHSIPFAYIIAGRVTPWAPDLIVMLLMIIPSLSLFSKFFWPNFEITNGSASILFQRNFQNSWNQEGIRIINLLELYWNIFSAIIEIFTYFLFQNSCCLV